MEKYNYEFSAGFDKIEKGESDMVYIRRRGQELAKELGKDVRTFLYNDALGKWDMVGTSHPNGLHTDAFGCQCKLDEDGRHYWKVGHLGTCMDKKATDNH